MTVPAQLSRLPYGPIEVPGGSWSDFHPKSALWLICFGFLTLAERRCLERRFAIRNHGSHQRPLSPQISF